MERPSHPGRPFVFVRGRNGRNKVAACGFIAPEGPNSRSNIMASERELIDTGTDKRYVRRDEKGQFKEEVDVGRSLAADQRQHSRTKAKKGQGDRGDR